MNIIENKNMNKKITKSLSKYFRSQKAKIRHDVCDLKKQKELIEKLYSDKGIKFEKNEAQGNL